MTMLKINPEASNAFSVELYGYNKTGKWDCVSILRFTSDGGCLTVTSTDNKDVVAEVVSLDSGLPNKEKVQSFMLHLTVVDEKSPNKQEEP